MPQKPTSTRNIWGRGSLRTPFQLIALRRLWLFFRLFPLGLFLFRFLFFLLVLGFLFLLFFLLPRLGGLFLKLLFFFFKGCAAGDILGTVEINEPVNQGLFDHRESAQGI